MLSKKKHLSVAAFSILVLFQLHCGRVWESIDLYGGGGSGFSSFAYTQVIQMGSMECGSCASVAIVNLNAQTAGNSNILFVTWVDGGTTVNTVSDSAGNSYSLVSPVTPQNDIAVYYASGIHAATAGANTITVTFNAADTNPEINLMEVSGLGNLPDTAVATSNAFPTYSENLTTTNPEDMVFCFAFCGGGCLGMTNGFNLSWETLNFNSLGYLNVNSTGTYTCSGGQSGTGVSEMVAFPIANSVGLKIGLRQVQGNYNPTASISTSVPLLADQMAGDLNVVTIGWQDTTHTISSVTDTVGNTYTLAVGPIVGSGNTGAIYYASNIAAAVSGTNAVKVQFSGATEPEISVLEYQSVTPLTLDVGTGAFGNSVTAGSGNITTNYPTEILVSMLETTGGFQQSASAGFDILEASRGTNGSLDGLNNNPAYQITSSAGVYQNTFGISYSGPWVSLIAGFH